jgi:hypothetical protein
MRRVFLGVGDKAGDAFITEGLPGVRCSNPPPRVEISTLGMSTYCPTCKQEGYIAPRGPRRGGTAINGKQWALSGDVNICGCSPPPVFHAERNMAMTFTREEVEALTGNVVTRSSSAAKSATACDEQVRAVAVRASLAGYPFCIETADGRIESGRLDSSGLLPRIFTDDADAYVIHWGDEAMALEECR